MVSTTYPAHRPPTAHPQPAPCPATACPSPTDPSLSRRRRESSFMTCTRGRKFRAVEKQTISPRGSAPHPAGALPRTPPGRCP
eukprot:4747144-Prymnesium_polylepis.1